MLNLSVVVHLSVIAGICSATMQYRSVYATSDRLVCVCALCVNAKPFQLKATQKKSMHAENTVKLYAVIVRATIVPPPSKVQC